MSTKINGEIKYTAAGQKVVVIGDLNSGQKIVQEIFIVAGQEVPSGENFVVSGLHDAPAISWKEKNLKELEERYEKERRDWDRKINSLNELNYKKNAELKSHLDYVGVALKNISPASFDLVVMFLTGNIKWVVMDSYSPEIKEFSLANTSDCDIREKLRLLSIFGRDDGTLTYAIGQYSDYSGGHAKITPFSNYDDAFEYFKQVVIKKGINDDSLKIAQKYNIKFPKEAIEEYKAKRSKEYEGYITKKKEEIADYESKISTIKSL